MIESCDVRGHLVQLDQAWLTARQRMQYPATVQHVLGEAFTAAALLAATIKYEGKLTFQIRGDGPVHLLVVQVAASGNLRGLARWKSVPETSGLAEMFGANARMTITIEARAGAAPQQGIVELAGESLADTLASYFHNSEQLQTALYLAVGDNTAAGLLLQRLPRSERLSAGGMDIKATPQSDSEPGAEGDAAPGSDPTSDPIEGWKRATALAETLQLEELLTLDASTLLHRLYHEEKVRLFESVAVAYECSCSRSRTDGLILGLGQEEAESICEEQGDVSITCEFCAAEYRYDTIDIAALFNPGTGELTNSNSTRH